MYPGTEMLISVQKYKLHYRKISPILSTQITAPCIIYKVPTDFFPNFLKNIFLYRKFYSCTKINISVLGYILLYRCIHVFHCTEEYSGTTDEYICSGVYVFFY